MKKRFIAIPALAALVGLGGACASTHTPSQLEAARSTYDNAASGRAGTVAPDELYDAKKALDVAEKEYRDDGDSWIMRKQAYIAMRKAQTAMVIAETRDASSASNRAEERKDELSEQMRKDANQKLGQTQDQLEAERAKRQQAETARVKAETARVQAEVDAQAAKAQLKEQTEKLREFARVTEEARGLVINLSSGTVFASGQSVILPAANNKLDQVAELMKKQPERKATVEGHTDADGSDAFNLMLSQQRADAVRIYLIARGVDSSRISAIGLGESRPVADNRTSEGKANNRRVEIVLSPLPVPLPSP